jgi:hypothetical protein
MVVFEGHANSYRGTHTRAYKNTIMLGIIIAWSNCFEGWPNLSPTLSHKFMAPGLNPVLLALWKPTTSWWSTMEQSPLADNIYDLFKTGDRKSLGTAWTVEPGDYRKQEPGTAWQVEPGTP